MRVRILPVVLFVLVLGVDIALSQAAAESVLLNGNSAAVAAKAGTVLGNTLNESTHTTAGKIQTVGRSKAVANRRGTGSQTPLQTPSTGSGKGASMITSIRGGRVTSSSTAPPLHR
ncbi:MAG TPA: hypothetical protein VJQ82_02395 [Terriglobales bacterium]|nr:hypothetical protein [Terriglobales bacterium]